MLCLQDSEGPVEGSTADLMVEVLRELGIRYIAVNPGASYCGLHDSLVNFGPGKPAVVDVVTQPR